MKKKNIMRIFLSVLLCSLTAIAQQQVLGMRDFSRAGKLRLPSSTISGLPVACAPGEIIFTTDATPGLNGYFCTASGVWTRFAGTGSGTVTSVVAGTCITIGGTATDPTVTVDASCAALQAGNNTFIGVNGFGMGTGYTAKDCPNAGTTGTTNKYLAKISGATCVLTAASTDYAMGIVVSGAGTTGSARIAQSGYTTCTFDNSPSVGDYVIGSATGKCHGNGASRPASGTPIIGTVQAAISGSDYTVSLGLDSNQGGGSGITPSYVFTHCSTCSAMGNSAYVSIAFDVTDHDTSSGALHPNNTDFVALATGGYQAHCSVDDTSNGSNAIVFLEIFINGSLSRQIQPSGINGTSAKAPQTNGPLYLTSGDVVTCRANAGGDTPTGASMSFYRIF